MLDVHQWVILLAVAAFVAQDTTTGPQLLVSEPLVAGSLSGWLAGDAHAGLLIGVAVQLVWCGAVPAGARLFLDVNVATVCAVFATVLVGAGQDKLLVLAVALAWVIPVGLLGCGLTGIHRRVCRLLVESVDETSDSGRTVALRHLTGWALAGVRGMLTVALGVPLGIIVIPAVAELAGPFVRSELLWAGILGAGGGTAVGATWRYSRGKAALLGASAALGAWALVTYAV